jgi:valyl-tRNA synthetase
MSRQLPKIYNPKETEDKIYQLWEKSGFFNPDNLALPKTAKSYSVAMPLPNVTGELHLGHAAMLTIEDLLTRFRRMQGYKALWIPGTDHAGIATQVMVEKELAKEGKTKWDLGREKFLERVWQFKEKSEKKIIGQIKKTGASCDWSRYHFTLDQNLVEAVNEAFIRLYQDGLIYRGKRMINWCPRCQTVLSDLEVDHKEEKGKLWYIKYPLKSKTGYIKVATTRPETMLGDTAVAVNPKDKRYKNLVGQKVILPIMNQEIPIISDFRVDPEFGTGAVKVTPAHDLTDWEIGQEHKLTAPQVIGKNGKMTEEAKEFAGLSVFEARQKIIERLTKEGLLEKVEDYFHSVGHCYRCGKTIESLVSKQWFVKIKPLAKKAQEVVKKGEIKIIPQRFEKVYFNWMENIKDWCISRQLWWGHTIPVWYCQDCHDHPEKHKKGEYFWLVKKGIPKKCPRCSSIKIHQDKDVLDTWFSSALWTFATLGWPKETKDLKFFHPTSCMETGWDILFFWVARMMMMSLYLLKEIPFKTVYLHGLVLDSKTGEKMSKSKGTGLNPLVITDKYGADALRLSLVLGTTAGQDFKLYEQKIAGYRNFNNKLWNITRFTLSQNFNFDLQPSVKKLTLANQWILSRLNKIIQSVTEDLENFRLGKAGEDLYEFTWHEFADWYLEVSKFQEKSLTFYALSAIIKLLHPFTPFITEEIWQSICQTGSDQLARSADGACSTLKTEPLMIQSWPVPVKKLINTKAEKEFKIIQNIIIGIRNIRAKHKIEPAQIVKAYAFTKTKKKLVGEQKKIIERLARVELEVKSQKTKVKEVIAFSVDKIELVLEI